MYKKVFTLAVIALPMILGSCRGFKTTESDSTDSLSSDSTRHFQVDSIVIENNTDTCIDISNNIQYLKGKGTVVDSINQTIMQMATGEPRGTTLHFAIQHYTDSLFQDCKSEEAEWLSDEMPLRSDNFSYEMTGRFLDSQGKPLSNKANGAQLTDTGILSYQFESWAFLGGAHGSYAFNFLNFNTATGHLMTPWDVLDKRQEKKILDLLLQQLLRDNDCKTKDELMDKTGILAMGELTVTSNFLITDKGLMFHYGQYELACYAAGMQDIDLSWETLEQNGCLISK